MNNLHTKLVGDELESRCLGRNDFKNNLIRSNSIILRQIEYYCKLGWSIHPLKGKIPMLDGWQKKATTNFNIIKSWLEKWPTANIGIVTGAISNLLVLDIDGANGKNSIQGLDLLNAPSVSTANGEHYYYQFPHDITASTTRTGLLNGVDTRGSGGYIVAPPSINYECGAYLYNWVVPLSENLPMPPSWLLDLLMPNNNIPNRIRAVTSCNNYNSNYANAALMRECEDIERAAKGTRNARLNRAAFSIGTLITAGNINIEYAIEALTTAALNAGLRRIEIDKTIASGLKAGINKPRKS